MSSWHLMTSVTTIVSCHFLPRGTVSTLQCNCSVPQCVKRDRWFSAPNCVLINNSIHITQSVRLSTNSFSLNFVWQHAGPFNLSNAVFLPSTLVVRQLHQKLCDHRNHSLLVGWQTFRPPIPASDRKRLSWLLWRTIRRCDTWIHHALWSN